MLFRSSPANGRTSRHPSAPTSEFEGPGDSDVVVGTDSNGKTGRSFPNDPDFRNKALMSASVRTHDDMNADGFFNDVDIQAIDEPNKRREDKTRDVTTFFGTVHTTKTVNGKVRHVRDCEICQYVIPISCFLISLPHSKKGLPCELVLDA